MYTKVFRQIYDGTLADNWRALITFQQLLILSDEQGVVDMTISAISRTTGIPTEILLEGIAHLEAPDPESRTPDMEGRRICRLDQHREWGWFLVNFNKYKELRAREEKREADRVRIATKRDITRQAATRSDMSKDVANVAHTDTDTNKDVKTPSPSGDGSVGESADQATASTPSVDQKRAERLAQVTTDAIETFNASELVKPKGGALPTVKPLVGFGKRQKQVARCIKTAREICTAEFGEPKITRDFWSAYWSLCAADPFLSGRGTPGKGHENWLPDFEFLTREATLLKTYDRSDTAA